MRKPIIHDPDNCHNIDEKPSNDCKLIINLNPYDEANFECYFSNNKWYRKNGQEIEASIIKCWHYETFLYELELKNENEFHKDVKTKVIVEARSADHARIMVGRVYDHPEITGIGDTDSPWYNSKLSSCKEYLGDEYKHSEIEKILSPEHLKNAWEEWVEFYKKD